MIDIILNAFIFLVTVILVILMFRKDGQWDIKRGKSGFRFYTVQSNCLCAAVSLSSCHSDAHAAPGVVDSPIFVSDTMLYKDHSFIIIRERFNPYFQVLHSPSCACRYNRHFVIVKRKTV